MEGAEAEMELSSVDTSWIKEEPGEQEEVFVDVLQMPCEDGHGETEDEIDTDDTIEMENVNQYGQEDDYEKPGCMSTGENWCVKRKRNDQDQEECESPTKIVIRRVKQEPVNDYAENVVMMDAHEISDGVEISAETLKEEQYETDIEESSEDDSTTENQQAHIMKKCTKCAKMFVLESPSLPAPLQEYCSKCQPSVSITCRYCGKHFEHHKLYSRHVRDCSKDNIKCKYCDDAFSSEQQLMRHKCIWAQTVRLLRFVCPICCEGFEKNKTRNNHKSLHVAPRAMHCSHCLEMFEDLWEYQKHLDVHLIPRQFICTFCSKSFESRSLFDADQARHKRELGDRFELRPAPDFVYVCNACKNWYPSMFYFERHDCHAVSIRDPSSLTNVVMRALDFGATTGPTTRKRTQSTALRAASREKLIPSINTISKNQRSCPSMEQASENGVVDLDPSFTCQLCKDSFMTPTALGYHPCLVMHSGFDVGDSDSEEESENPRDMPIKTETGDISTQIIGANNRSKHVDKSRDAEANEYTKLQPKKVNFSDIQPQTQPPPQKIMEISHDPSPRQQGSTGVQMDVCYMCGRPVEHSFAPCIGKKQSKYICTTCLQVLGKVPMYKFKCSKCWQVFPSLARLHMHMPWHKNKSDTEDQIVFRKPRLSCIRHKDAETNRIVLPPEGKLMSCSTAAHDASASEPLSTKQRLCRDASLKAGDTTEPCPTIFTFLHKDVEGKSNQSTRGSEPVATKHSLKSGDKQVHGDTALKAGSATEPCPAVMTLKKKSNFHEDYVSVNIAGSQSLIQQTLLPKTTIPLPAVNQQAHGNQVTGNKTTQQKNMIFDIGAEGQSRRVVQVLPVPLLQNNQQNVQLVQVPGTFMQAAGCEGSLHKSTQMQLVGKANPLQNNEQNAQFIQVPGTFTQAAGNKINVFQSAKRQLVGGAPAPLQNNQQVVQVMQAPVESMQAAGSKSIVNTSAHPQLLGVTNNPSKPSSKSVLTQLLSEPLKKSIVPNRHSSINQEGMSGNLSGKMAQNLHHPQSHPMISVVATGNSSAEVTLSETGSQQANKAVGLQQFASAVGLQPVNKVMTPQQAVSAVDLQQLARVTGLQQTAKPEIRPKGWFLCNTCKTLCKDIVGLKTHGCNIQVYTCHLCSEKFSEPERLYKHRCRAQSFLCHMCHRNCSSAEELNQHPCIESNDIRINPGSNMAATGDSAGLNKAAKSPEKSRFCCPTCNVNFKSKSALYVHKMRHTLKT